MYETFIEAREEIKRADHLIFVSLKYTRTVDVIKSIIERFINAYELSINALLKKLETEGKIEEIPASVFAKVELVRKIFPEDLTLSNDLTFYLSLRIISRAKFTKAREFRRHVTMTAELPDGTLKELTIDTINEDFIKTKEFIEKIKNYLYPPVP